MAYTSDSIENIIKSLTIGDKTYPLGVQYADKADSMNVTAAVGSSKQPVYLKADGTFGTIKYSISKSVPSTAVFTDTTYQLTLNGTTNGGGTTDLGTIYAPTSAGTNGQYLMSNGSGAPSWADFSTLLSPYVTKQNLEAYGNWITIFANSSNNYDVGFKVLNETNGNSTIMDSDGILFHNGSTNAMICLQNNSNILYLGPTNVAIDGDLHIYGSKLHLGIASADVTISTDVDHHNADNSHVAIFNSRLEVDNTIYLSDDNQEYISISTNANAADPSVKTLFIDSDLEIGSTLYLSDNQIDHASIWTDGGGDLLFDGTNFEFGQSGNFIVNGPISLKGAKNTGSATKPIYIDNLGEIKPTTYTLGASVPSTAKFTDTTYKLTLNGTTKGSGSTNLGSIYAPTSAGTNGQYLKSNGTGAPTWVDLPDFSCIMIGTPENPNMLNNENVVTINNSLEIGGTLYLTNDYNNWVSISTEVDNSDPYESKKSVIIDSDLEIGSTLYLSNNQIDYASIQTDGGGDLIFSGGNFVVNGPVSLKGAANTGSATKPIYIDANGKFNPTTYTLGASVPPGAKFTDTTYKLTLNGTTNGSGSTNLGSIYAPISGGTSGQYLMSNGSGAPTWVDLPDINNLVNQISQLQNRISQLESIITSYIGPIN